jgi:hypothetical protein
MTGSFYPRGQHCPAGHDHVSGGSGVGVEVVVDHGKRCYYGDKYELYSQCHAKIKLLNAATETRQIGI